MALWIRVNINFYCTLKNDIALGASASCNIMFLSAIKIDIAITQVPYLYNINKSFININKSFININKSFININKSFININKSSAFFNINKSFIDIDKSFININKYFLILINIY